MTGDDPGRRAALRASARRLLASWQAPDSEQNRLRRFILGFLDDHPDATSRACRAGHLVASAVVLDTTRSRVLLVRPATIGLWTELGGHLEDEDVDVAAGALREAREESGIADLRLDSGLIDLEVFPDDCPAGRPSRHLDLRFLVTAPPGSTPVLCEESLDVGWFPVDGLPHPLGLAVRRSVATAARVAARPSGVA